MATSRRILEEPKPIPNMLQNIGQTLLGSGLQAPSPPLRGDGIQMLELEQQLYGLDNPAPLDNWGLLAKLGQGISPMDPGQFQQMQQQKIGQEFAMKQQQRQNVVQQIRDIQDRKRQGEMDAMARTQFQNQQQLHPLQLRTATANAQGLEKEVNAPPAIKYGQRDVERDGKKFREYYNEAEPGVATDIIELGAVADTPRNIDPLSPEGIAARVQLETQLPPPTGPQTPIAIIGPNGQPTYVPPSQAIGQQPASTREQGRPVGSSDANRIADFDTSLDDLVELRGTIPAGATGTAAKVGAMLPNVVTDLTGWGLEAKQKQAVIDRVKQVIGKALEGGVLRKEDEYKYEKILPTIADRPEVVRTKLDGLERAIAERRVTLLDALQDAGYDTAAFRRRGQGASGSAAPADPLGIR